MEKPVDVTEVEEEKEVETEESEKELDSLVFSCVGPPYSLSTIPYGK